MSVVLDPPGADSLDVHELGDADRADLVELVAGDPVVNAVVDARLAAARSLTPRRFGGQLLGVRGDDGRLRAAAFNGGNFLPIGGGPDDWRALARHAAQGPRGCTSIVGRADAVRVCWQQLAGVWGPARVVRRAQPMLVTRTATADRPSPVGVRPAEVDEFEPYLAASAQMFTEELGVSPFAGPGAVGYRNRVVSLIRDRRAFCVLDRHGEIVFKADFGAVSPRTCQIQGVWTRPDVRGRGLGTAAMVGVLDQALMAAPSASLYVNDFNEPARRLYARLGMREIAVLSTVLL